MDDDAYVLRVTGNSLKPRIREGEYLLVEPNERCEGGDTVLVELAVGDTLIKELVYERNGEVCLNRIGDSTDRIVRDREDVVFVHKISAILPPSTPVV